MKWFSCYHDLAILTADAGLETCDTAGKNACATCRRLNGEGLGSRSFQVHVSNVQLVGAVKFDQVSSGVSPSLWREFHLLRSLARVPGCEGGQMGARHDSQSFWPVISFPAEV